MNIFARSQASMGVVPQILGGGSSPDGSMSVDLSAQYCEHSASELRLLSFDVSIARTSRLEDVLKLGWQLVVVVLVV